MNKVGRSALSEICKTSLRGVPRSWRLETKRVHIKVTRVNARYTGDFKSAKDICKL